MGERIAGVTSLRSVLAAAISTSRPVCGLALLLLSSQFAAAQGSFPWARFVELSERKGDEVTQGGPCQHFGLNPSCRAYQVASQDDEWMHAFNVLSNGRARTGHIILFKRSDAGLGRFYLTDHKGKLLKALSRSEGVTGARSSWSKLEVKWSAVRRGFADELAYWRAKQSELEAAPDRKN